MGGVMPLAFTEVNKDYIVKKITGNEESTTFLMRLGIVENKKICIISSSGAGFIISIDNSRIAIDRKLANKIIVEELN